MTELNILPAPPEKPKRSLNVALPEAVEAKLREMAALTKLPVYGLAEHVADSPEFAKACLKVLRARYVEWWNEHNDADTIFGPEEEG